jgi:hypothetical protein
MLREDHPVVLFWGAINIFMAKRIIQLKNSVIRCSDKISVFYLLYSKENYRLLPLHILLQRAVYMYVDTIYYTVLC